MVFIPVGVSSDVCVTKSSWHFLSLIQGCAGKIMSGNDVMLDCVESRNDDGINRNIRSGERWQNESH